MTHFKKGIDGAAVDDVLGPPDITGDAAHVMQDGLKDADARAADRDRRAFRERLAQRRTLEGSIVGNRSDKTMAETGMFDDPVVANGGKAVDALTGARKRRSGRLQPPQPVADRAVRRAPARTSSHCVEMASEGS